VLESGGNALRGSYRLLRLLSEPVYVHIPIH
jgi:hypothetical protein